MTFHNFDSLTNSTESKYRQIIFVADSLFYSKNQCDASILYRLAKGLLIEDYPDSMLAQVVHPLECNGVDNFYYKIVHKADEYFLSKDFDKAREFYNRSITFNPWDAYPRNQNALMEKTVHNSK